MAFDIHQLDELEDQDKTALDEYIEGVMKTFVESPQGQARLAADRKMGFWVTALIRYGYEQIGVTLPQMRERQIENILLDVFPRKVSILDPNGEDDAIPALAAFWEHLKEAYGLPQADAILRLLRRIEPQFREEMNKPSNWGMAKSMVMAGAAAGFDMTDQKQMDMFFLRHNAMIASQQFGSRTRPIRQLGPNIIPIGSGTEPTRIDRHRERARARNQRKAARRRNRRR